ncbi:hypothetical protein D3C75_650370 [compost metagenome]
MYSLAEHIIRFTECLQHRSFLVYNFQEPIIRNNDQCINLFLKCFDSEFCLISTLSAFKSERAGHDAYGQCSAFSGDFSNDWSCACTGAAAHSSSYENHVCTFKRIRYQIAGLFGCFLPYFRVGTCAQPPGKLVPDLQFMLRFGHMQRLGICINRDEFNTLNAIFNHPVDSIASAAAYADDLYLRQALHFKIKFQHIVPSPPQCAWMASPSISGLTLI